MCFSQERIEVNIYMNPADFACIKSFGFIRHFYHSTLNTGVCLLFQFLVYLLHCHVYTLI